MADDDVKRLMAEGKTARVRQLVRERATGAPTPRPPIYFILLILLGVVTAALVLVVAVVDGVVERSVSAVVHRVAPWPLEPFAPLLLSPGFLAVVGAAILLWGLPRTQRYRRPGRFRAGVIALALALITFWPLQFLASRLPVSFAEFKTALHILAGFMSICLLTGGLESIRMSNNTPRGDAWEFLR